MLGTVAVSGNGGVAVLRQVKISKSSKHVRKPSMQHDTAGKACDRSPSLPLRHIGGPRAVTEDRTIKVMPTVPK